MEERTERESDRRNGRLVGATENSKERAEWRRLQRKNLKILSLPKRRVWPQCNRKSRWQVRQSRLFQKEKEQSNRPIRLSRSPDRKGGESQDEREPHLGERGRSEREHEEERVHFTAKKGRFQVGKGGQARRASLGEVEGSISGKVNEKSLQDNQKSLALTPSLTKSEMGDEETSHKEVRRRRARS